VCVRLRGLTGHNPCEGVEESFGQGVHGGGAIAVFKRGIKRPLQVVQILSPILFL
jgi:hypothetical protein